MWFWRHFKPYSDTALNHKICLVFRKYLEFSITHTLVAKKLKYCKWVIMNLQGFLTVKNTSSLFIKYPNKMCFIMIKLSKNVLKIILPIVLINFHRQIVVNFVKKLLKIFNFRFVYKSQRLNFLKWKRYQKNRQNNVRKCQKFRYSFYKIWKKITFIQWI